MKIIVIGAAGTIGQGVAEVLNKGGHEVVRAGRSSHGFPVDITSRESIRAFYKKVQAFDAVAVAAGEIAFAPLEGLGEKEWAFSLQNKLLGQIQVVQEAVPWINAGGSFTLISGVLSTDPIPSGVAATTVNRALEGFVAAAAIALPKGLRINAVSPTVLEESMADYAPFFPGFVPVSRSRVAQAYLKSILGRQTGQVYRVH